MKSKGIFKKFMAAALTITMLGQLGGNVAMAKEATAEIPTKKEYAYSDEHVSVTATLEHAAAVPDDAEFCVTPVTAVTDGYNYDAYMQALNDHSQTIAAANGMQAPEEDAYTDENTMLYDISFMVDKTDEEGNVIPGEKIEYQPEEGSVKFTFVFKEKQLENQENVAVVHLPLEESVREAVDSTAEATDISADDVEIEMVDAQVLNEATEEVAEFSLTSLSLVAFVGVEGQALNPGADWDYRSILGEAVYYGILSNTINKTGHMDTNFATKYLTGTGNVTAGAYTQDKNGGLFIIADKDGQQFAIDGSAVNVWCTESGASTISLQSGSTKLLASKEFLESFVDDMMDHIITTSAAMAAESTYVVNSIPDQNNADIDLTSRPDGTYYISLKELLSGAQNGAIKVKKTSKQTIVFNYTGTDPIALERFSVWNVDVENGYQSSATSNGAIDVTAKTIVFNMPNVTSFSNEGGVCGILIAPKATFNIGSTSSGWLITDTMSSSGGEWHNVWGEMPKLSEIPEPIELSALKYLDAAEPNVEFSFVLEEYKNGSWSTVETVQNKGSVVEFSKITYTEEGTHYYRISEVHGSGDYTYDAQKFVVKIVVKKATVGNKTVYYVDSLKHYKTSEVAGAVASSEVPNAVFHNATKEATEQISVQKKWNDANDNDGIRPESIQVQLSANGAAQGEAVVLNEANNWSYTWKDLPSGTDGTSIDYSVVEVNVPEGYRSALTGTMETGFVLTNTHDVEKISVSGIKKWEDQNNRDGIRPETVTVNLYADGVYVKSDTVSADADGNWNYTFQYLNKYNNGKEITYTVDEEAVEGYETKVTGYTITNTHKIKEMDVSVEKIWRDNEDQDGIRPETIQVQLYADGDPYGAKVTLRDRNLWTYIWNNLPVYRAGAQGQEIVYTVKEVGTIEGYQSIVSGGVTNGFKVTNVHKVEVTEISVRKDWNDANNQDGIRPKSIEVQLYADEEALGNAIILNQANHWSYTWENLAKKDDGEEIHYSVEENGVPEGYVSVTTGNEKEGFVITNTHETAKTKVHVTKVWMDNNNQDQRRPETIRVQLYADGKMYGTPVTLSGTDTEPWEYEWTGLNKYYNGKEIVYTVKEMDIPYYYESDIAGDAENGYIITNSYEREVKPISVKKVWDDNNNQDGVRPDSIVVELWSNLSDTGAVARVTLDASNNWSFRWNSLPKYYDQQEIQYRIVEPADVPGYVSTLTGSAEEGYVITNTHETEETAISVKKVWEDANNRDGIRPESMKVQLLANGAAQGEAVELSSANQWSYTWEDLPANKNGKAIVYTVDEVELPEGYISTITGDAAKGYVITNRHTTEKINLPVKKIWYDKDNQDGIRPSSIQVQLYANNKVYGSAVTLNETNYWFYEWNGLPRNAEGKTIAYTVKELGVPAKYTSIVSGGTENGFVITNSYKTEVTEISVKKVWEDDDNQDEIRPNSVRVQLYADGTAIEAPVVLDAANGWSYTWEELAKNDDGKKIKYTVKELEIPNGYEAVVTEPTANSFVITNSHDVKKTDISVKKVWVDKDDIHDVRPDSVKVQLYADGSEVGEAVTLNESNGWSYKWKDLPVNKARAIIAYTVEELDVPENYTSVVSGGIENGFIITNSCEHLEMIEIPVKKIWTDGNDQDRKRPDRIQIQLIADGEPEGDPVVLDEVNNWSYKWEKLEKNGDGELIVYTVEEVEIPDGYRYVVTGDNIHGYVVNNIHEVAEREVSVKKVWDDADDQDGIRPEQISVQLLADGENYGDVITLKEANNWNYTWKKLPVNKDGKEITYTIKEVEVPEGYSSVITGDVVKGYVITNKHAVEKFDLPVKKVWYDKDNQDGIRPKTIKVQLYANEEPVGKEIVLQESNHWSHTWKDLPRNAEGKTIDYTVKELDVPKEYTSIVSGGTENGFVITNSYQTEVVGISVKKQWDDNENQDGFRPKAVKVQLYANGKAIEEPIVLDEANKWSYTWEELAKNAAGKTILYEVKEINVPKEYTSKVTGNAKDGYVLINRHETIKQDISVSKVWIDKDDIHGIRPEEIEVQLFANGAPTGTSVILDESNGWTHTWKALDKYAQGKLISYSVVELKMPEGYESVVSGGTENGFIITNSCDHLEMIEIPVQKIWADQDDQAGLRPESVTVQLYADGEPEGSPVILDEANGWSYKWEKLEKNEDGQLIVYTVEETEVSAGYIYDITGNNVDGYCLTNTLTSVEISKVDAATKKPLSGAKIQLLDSNGTIVDEWESTKGPHTVLGLKVGEVYTLRETKAPKGYSAAADSVFVLGDNGEIVTDLTTAVVDEDGSLLIENVKVKDDKPNKPGDEEPDDEPDDDDPKDEPDDSEDKKPEEKPTGKGAPTGDAAPIGIYAAISAFSLAGLFAIIKKRHQK